LKKIMLNEGHARVYTHTHSHTHIHAYTYTQHTKHDDFIRLDIFLEGKQSRNKQHVNQNTAVSTTGHK